MDKVGSLKVHDGLPGACICHIDVGYVVAVAVAVAVIGVVVFAVVADLVDLFAVVEAAPRDF